MQHGTLRRLAELETQRRPIEPIRAVFRIVDLTEDSPDWMRPGTADYESAQRGEWPVDNFSADLSTGVKPVDNFLRIELEPGDTLLDVALELRITRDELQARMDAGSIELIYPTEDPK